MHSLDDMQLFVEVAKSKSFVKTAESLGLATSTVSQRIQNLEKFLGVRLLNRTTRKTELTEAGQLYFERALPIVDEARRVHLMLDGLINHPQGVLKISAPVEFSQIFIAPILPEFCRRYPEVRPDFHLSPRRVDLIGEPFDVAVRIGGQEDSGLTARRLAVIDGGLYASPAYLAERGTPTEPEDLGGHECLRFRHGLGDVWTLSCRRTARRVQIPIHGRIRTDSPKMNAQLAASGMGIALLPELVAGEEEAQGRLVRILPDWHNNGMSPVYAVTATRLMPKKAQVFIDFLQEHLQRSATGGKV